MIPRAYKGAGLILLCLSLYVFGRCSARNDGRDIEKSAQLQAQADMHRKAAILYRSQADIERRVNDSLRKKLVAVSAKVAESQTTLIKATQKYELLRDSVLKAPHSNTESDIIASADSALSASSTVIKAHEAKDVVQDSLIASQQRRIGFLESALSEREEQIKYLNSRIVVEVRRRKRGRYEGVVAGVAAAGFVWIGSQASK